MQLRTNIVRLNGFFISKLYLLISFNTRQNAGDQTNSCNSRRTKDTLDHVRFSYLVHNTNSNKQQFEQLEQRRARCWAKSSVMLARLESAQVDQIVSIYSDPRLYYKLNNFVS